MGVIAVDPIPCAWQDVEDLVLGARPADHFRAYEAYERTYLSPEDVYFAASRSGAFTPVTEAFDPYAPGFDPTPLAPTLLLTHNVPDPAAQPLVGDLPPFTLEIEARHGRYPVGDRTVGLAAVLSYARAATWQDSGANGIRQTFAMELIAELDAEETLRMLAVWSDPDILGIDASTPIALLTAVNQARSSSDDLRRSCEALKASR